MVTFAAGYIAGVFCAIVSHPADTVVSKLNQEKGSTALEAAKKLGFYGNVTVYICVAVITFHWFTVVTLVCGSALIVIDSSSTNLNSYIIFLVNKCETN